jgi:chemotaxis protein methyltransferase CheR
MRVRKLIYEHAALVLEDGKEYLVESRLAPLARQHGYDSVDALCEVLSARCDLAVEVVEAMTTNETSFFRDQHPFDALREHILPPLLQSRANKRALRIWCAACSTGQEPYSLAMMLDEHFPQLASWDVRIDATDVSRAVIARAKLGRYSQLEVSRGLPPRLLSKYFYRDREEWEIRPELRRLVRFSELNLIRPWTMMDIYDVVFLRNVLIYFDAATKLSILAKVYKQTARDGYLVLGGSESTPREVTSFVRVPIARAGIYKVKGLRPSLVQVR